MVIKMEGRRPARDVTARFQARGDGDGGLHGSGNGARGRWLVLECLVALVWFEVRNGRHSSKSAWVINGTPICQNANSGL